MVAAKIATLERGRPPENTAIAVITQEHAAKLLNVSIDSTQRAREVLDKATPELVHAVEQGKVAVSQAAALTKASPDFQKAVVQKLATGEAKRPQEAIRQVKAEKAKEQEAILPSGKFRVIYADPPWSYGNTQPDSHSDTHSAG